ncbi:MAG: hypothetical protein C0408_00160 [Odoribacter sp.]|nr:hypothetical protein [Odoribacter sp.]
MKQKIYILGLLTVLVLVSGTIFKVNHYPGAGILLTVGILTLVLVFLPFALVNNYRAEGNSQTRPLYIATWITALVVFTSMLFKIQHWSYAGIMLMISLPFPYVVFLPVFLIVTSKIKNFNIYNTVYVLFLMAVFSGFSALLALTVTRERIQESVSLAIHYNKFENAIMNLPPETISHSGTIKYQEVIRKADEALKIVDEVQLLLLSKAGITEEQWNRDPGSAPKLDHRNVTAEIFLGQEPQPGYRLEAGIKSFLDELDKTPGCKELAALAPVMMGFIEPGDRELAWAERLFAGNYLSWALIDMDAIELNILLLKREISAL